MRHDSDVDIVVGAFGSTFALSETLTRATPLIFTGLAAWSGADMTISWQAEVDDKVVRYREQSFMASDGFFMVATPEGNRRPIYRLAL